jgi:prevent-host-death family protein
MTGPAAVDATEARVRFGDLVRRVAENGETVVVERGGRPQVAFLPIAEFERLREGQQNPDWWEQVMRVRELIARELDGRPLPDIEEIIRGSREERDAQILDAVYRR